MQRVHSEREKGMAAPPDASQNRSGHLQNLARPRLANLRSSNRRITLNYIASSLVSLGQRVRHQFADATLYHAVLATLLVSFGLLASGLVGLILAFWIMLLWFSVWQRPYRLEMMLLAALGLLGAALILPEKHWSDCNLYFMFAFGIVAASPILDLMVALFRRPRI